MTQPSNMALPIRVDFIPPIRSMPTVVSSSFGLGSSPVASDSFLRSSDIIDSSILPRE